MRANARVRDQLEAGPARARGHVDRRAVDHHAVLRGLDDGVGLGVDRGDAVVVLHHVADFVAVRHAPDRAVVAGREDRPIAHDHRADELARAGRARRDDLRDVHEVLVPGDALIHACASNMRHVRYGRTAQAWNNNNGRRYCHRRRAARGSAGIGLCISWQNRTHCVTAFSSNKAE